MYAGIISAHSHAKNGKSDLSFQLYAAVQIKSHRGMQMSDCYSPVVKSSAAAWINIYKCTLARAV